MGKPRGGATIITRVAGERSQTGRVAVVVGLLFAAGVTMRGTLPDHPAPREPAADSPGSLTGVIALLSVAMLVMAVALLRRDRLPPRPAPRELPDVRRGGRGRWDLRLGLIALGLLLAWLLAVVVLNRLGVGPDSRQLPTSAIVPDTGDVGPSTARPGGPSAPRSDTFRLLMASTTVLLVMTVVATVLTALRRARPAAQSIDGQSVTDAVVGPGPLAVAAERGLAEVANPSLQPREAIIACYAAMERALAGAPDAAPQASDTPSEVLARAVGNRTLSPGSAAELVALFAEARFSRHVMTEDHRGAAERALRAVLVELAAADSGSPV